LLPLSVSVLLPLAAVRMSVLLEPTS